MRQVLVGVLILGSWCDSAAAADKYSGPRPPKPDIPYLVHASNLIPTEVIDAQPEDKKDETIYIIPGAASTAKTPLAEPTFLIEADKLVPDKIGLWKLDTKGGRREIILSKKARRNGPRPLRLTVSRVEGRLYKLEVSQMLESGEYSLSPDGSDQTFCFSVY